MQLNINTDAAVKFTNTLEKLHKSALPVAIRGALNDAAFDVKIKTMPSKAAATFTQRQPNFFKANSKVEVANGFNVNTMKSTVGFFENKLSNQSTNYAVKDLEQQEHSGTIKSRTFIPTVFARKGNTKKGLVKPNLRISKIRAKIVDSSKMNGKNDREKYIKASIKSGANGFVLYKNILWKINALKAKSKIEREPIYTVKKGRGVNVKSTNFMKSASLESNRKMESYYIAQAKKQIVRLQ